MSINISEILKILFNSFKQASKWKFWKWLITGGSGGLFGSMLFGKNFLDFSIKDSIIYAFGAICLLFAIKFCLSICINFLKYLHYVYKNSVYGDAIILLKDSFSQTHYYRKTLEYNNLEYNDLEFMTAILSFCENLRLIFNKTTIGDCSVSIKVPLEDKVVDEKTVFLNLARDKVHQSRDTKNYDNIKHTLLGNTAFSTVFNNVITNSKTKFYVNNKVNETENYLNTSKCLYENEILPYNSELVFPIIPIKNPNNTNFDCLGFICIDSTKKDVFSDNRYNVPILEGVADGIFDLISERNKQKSN